MAQWRICIVSRIDDAVRLLWLSIIRIRVYYFVASNPIIKIAFSRRVFVGAVAAAAAFSCPRSRRRENLRQKLIQMERARLIAR